MIIIILLIDFKYKYGIKFLFLNGAARHFLLNTTKDSDRVIKIILKIKLD